MVRSEIFENKNGDRYKIEIQLHTEYSSYMYQWVVFVYIASKGRRKWIRLDCQGDREYIKLDWDGKIKFYQMFILRFVPMEWISHVQELMLAELSKPAFDSYNSSNNIINCVIHQIKEYVNG